MIGGEARKGNGLQPRLEPRPALLHDGGMVLQGPSEPARIAAAAERLYEELLELGVDRLPAAPPADPLQALAAEVAACQLCGLCESRHRTVPGEGHPQARIVFVGEAPGADEDQSGRPFVGAAGQLLTKIITQGMGLRRDEVFICNVLKCRPPGNRDPQPEEKAACTPYLERQLRAIQPELVIALGRHAANHLLQREDSLGRLRGQLHSHALGFPVLATYHPAYLLRSPAAKADCWQDIQIGMRHLGLPLPPRQA